MFKDNLHESPNRAPEYSGELAADVAIVEHEARCFSANGRIVRQFLHHLYREGFIADPRSATCARNLQSPGNAWMLSEHPKGHERGFIFDGCVAGLRTPFKSTVKLDREEDLDA